MQRHSVTARCAKSRQTPACSRVSFRRCPVAARMVVAELNAVVNVIADRLHACPAADNRPEQRPREIRKLLRVAVSAAVQERQHVVRQVLHCPLLCVRNDLVRQATVADQEVRADFKSSCGREKARPDVAERIEALPGRDAGAQLDALRREKVFFA